MEKKHRCKLCFKNFANGRALGGHMRSHMMKFYAEYSLPSSSEEEEEVETESSKICRRSKRVRESDFDVFENEGSSPVSSISDTTPEEHVAHCLMMMSRDTWHSHRRYDEEEEEEESKEIVMKKNKFRGKYRCEECNKLFRSYQALGGHRASHKKIKVGAPSPVAVGGVKIHQCPFCHRIFSSGQALGGHKRSHFVQNSTRISQVLSIDLNLPAPVDDDEGSQIVISDAEFVYSVKQ
ncbi:zinc finger protein ZAT4-like [Salvia divinorum]|uniref:Zinc finger protein ZAT4-like n=1 Tax=Salvia divinorum TaxID=28513 RepID=A0ABD1H112_SALDI